MDLSSSDRKLTGRSKSMSNKALLVVDVQRGLFDNPDSEIYQYKNLLQNINELIRKAREAKIQVVFIRHNDSGLPYRSSAWEIHEALEQADVDIYVDKKHCDSFLETKLHDVLKTNSIDQSLFADCRQNIVSIRPAEARLEKHRNHISRGCPQYARFKDFKRKTNN